MPFDVICIGDVSIDEFLKVDDAQIMCDVNHANCQICFNYADKIPVSEFRTSLGGNSANVAAGLAKLGLNVSVYAEVGNDANGKRFFEEFKARGIDTSLLKENAGESTNVHEIISYLTDRTIFSYHKEWGYRLPKFEDPKWIYYSSLAQNFADFQSELMDYLEKNSDVLLAFNPGTYHLKAGVKSFQQVLKSTHVLFVNKEEAMQITLNSGAPEKLHHELQKMGPKMTVITDAEKGASVMWREGFIQKDIYEISKPVKDKTGAGDAFTSGFLSALILGKNVATALDWGLKNSSSCIREIGPMNGLLGQEEIRK